MTSGEYRLHQLSWMMSFITGMIQNYCSDIIRETSVGQNVLDENEVTMYDQQTANLYDIAVELKSKGTYENIADQLTVDNIVKAMMNLHYLERRVI